MADNDLTIRIGVIDEASDKLVKVGDKVRATGDKIAASGRRITTAISLPIALAGGAAVKAFADFEKGLGNINTMLGKSDEPIQVYKDGILAISKEVPKSIDELTEAAFFAVSAGKKGAEGLEYVTEAAKLATAGATDVATSIKAVTSLTRGYGDASVSAGKAAEFLFAINEKGVTTFDEVANSIAKPVATANLLGVSQKELAAAFTTLVGTTGNADEVATQLQATFVGMLKPSTAMSDAISALGFESAEALIAQKGLNKSLELLKGQAIKSGDGVKSLFLNVRAMNGALPLMNQLSGEFTANMENMDNAAGNVQVAFEKQQKMVHNMTQQFKNKFNVVLIRLGEIILPRLIEIMDWLGDKLQGLSDWLGDLDPKWADLIVKAGLILVALGPVIFILGTVISTVGTLISVVGGLGKALVFLAANPVGMIITAIGLLVVAGVMLYKHWDEVKAFAIEVWGTISNWVGEKLNAIADFISSITSAISETWQAVWGKISDFFSATWDIITRVAEVAFGVLMGAMIALLDWLWPNWFETLTKVANFFAQVWEGAKTKFSAFTAWFKTMYTKVMGAFKAYWELTWGAVSKFFGSIWDSISTAFSEKWGVLAGHVQRGIEAMQEGFAKFGAGVSNLFSGIWDGIKNVFASGINWVIDKLNWLIQQYNKMPFARQIDLISRIGESTNHSTPQATPEQALSILRPDLVLSTGAASGGANQSMMINVSGNNFYGDDEEFANKIGDSILQSVKESTNANR